MAHASEAGPWAAQLALKSATFGGVHSLLRRVDKVLCQTRLFRCYVAAEVLACLVAAYVEAAGDLLCFPSPVAICTGGRFAS